MAITFGYSYAMPGLDRDELHVVSTAKARFAMAAVNYDDRYTATPEVARRLVAEHDVKMLELCGGLADARIVASVQEVVGDGTPVGAVHYGPESRKTIVELLSAGL